MRGCAVDKHLCEAVCLKNNTLNLVQHRDNFKFSFSSLVKKKKLSRKDMWMGMIPTFLLQNEQYLDHVAPELWSGRTTKNIPCIEIMYQ